jgi:very-short-patch-repair endonuclease
MPTDQHHHLVSKIKRNHARRLRVSQTDAETKLWRLLRGRRFVGFKFRRQVPFRNYILDFVCFEARLVVEIDGSQHAESKSDAIRDAMLRREGFQIKRYWNVDVLRQPNVVAEDIYAQLMPR